MSSEKKTDPRQNIMKKVLTGLIAPAIFVLLSCIYFLPQFSDQQLQQSDLMQFEGMAREAREFYEETGTQTLWTNAMFSGMPTYQITAWPDANKITWLEDTLNLFFPRPAGYFIFAQLAFYLLLLLLGVNRWLAIPLAIAFAFTTNNIQLYEAGHTSKLRTLFSAPLVIAGLVMTYRHKYLAGGIIFCAGLALNISTNHPQITYYLAICLAIFLLFKAVEAFREKTLPEFAKASGILVMGLAFAVLASGYNLYATYDYAQETMRGKPTLTATSENPTSSSQTEGLAWDYAMQWSNGVPDILATLIPRAAGGSSSEPTPDDSEWGTTLRRMGVPQQDAPLYWGPLPFTSGPAYFGAGVLFLFILGLFLVRGPVKWWLLIAVVLTTLLSMGKHFAPLTRLFFDYLPMYNKFRAPSSILTITALFVPILGGLAVAEFTRRRDQSDLRKSLIWSFGLVGGLSVVLALLGPGLFNFSSPSDARFAQAGIAEVLVADRKALFAADAWRSFAFVFLTAGILFAWLKGWIRQTWLVGVLLALVVLVDLWGVDRRYIAPEDFIPSRQLDAAFTPDAADREIMQDPDPHFRVHDLTTDAFQNSHRAYFHHMIGGYHAAKLQRYQDMIERYLSKGHEPVLNMLNTKYFILPGQGDQLPTVRQNPAALGNAWFVESIRVVDSAEEEIGELQHFDPRATAVVHKDFEHLVSGFDPVKQGTIQLTGYAPNKLVYRSESPSDQLAVFSEVWYGPKKGWHVTIDGQPSELLRANYILRAVNVPAGSHEIVMEFRPGTYYALRTVATIVSLAILAALAFVVFRAYRAGDPKPGETDPEPVSRKESPTAKSVRTKRKNK